ncbi:unnamed protein product, partial [Allacma fusca]
MILTVRGAPAPARVPVNLLTQGPIKSDVG